MKLAAFFFLSFLSSLYAQDTTALFDQHCRSGMCIYYAKEDARLLEETITVLERACDEIDRDLAISQKETLRVIIAPTREIFREYLRGNLPQWTHAFAVPAKGTMVVRSPRWDRPESSYRQSLVHELLHLLLFQRLRQRTLPRWLEEGMAIFYAEHTAYEKRAHLARALATGSLIPLQEIDRVLDFQHNRAQLAYQQSYSAVRYLLAVYDVEALNTILDGVAAGDDLDTVFIRATGSTMHGFEEEWHRYLDKTEKWLWLSEIDELIWLFLPLLALIVVYFVRRRNRRRLLEWEGLPDTSAGNDRSSQEVASDLYPGNIWVAPHLMRQQPDPAEGEEPPSPPERSAQENTEEGNKY